MKTLARLFHRWVMWWGAYLIYSLIYRHRRLDNMANRGEVKKILIVMLDYIGDNIMSSTLFPVLCSHFPLARLDILVGQWSEDLYEANPYIHKTIRYNCAWLNRGGSPPWPLKRKIEVLQQIHREKYDLIVEARGSWGTMALAFLLSSIYRVDLKVEFIRDLKNRFARKFFNQRHGAWLDHRRPYQMLQMLRQIGISVGSKASVSLFVPDECRSSAKSALIREGIDASQDIFCFHPCASDQEKLWAAEKWAQLGDIFGQKYSAQIVFNGAPSDRAQIQEIISRMSLPAVNLAGKVTLMQTVAVIELSRLTVGLDSGPMHIAGALDVPVVGLYGADDPKTCAPWTSRCRTIYHEERATKRMDMISVAEVVVAVEDLYATTMENTRRAI